MPQNKTRNTACSPPASIQYNQPHLLDGAGDAYHVSGLAWRCYYNKLAKDYGNQAVEVFSACPAAALYSHEEFLKVGGFDEDYFSYFEDVDLGFRLRSGEQNACMFQKQLSTT